MAEATLPKGSAFSKGKEDRGGERKTEAESLTETIFTRSKGFPHSLAKPEVGRPGVISFGAKESRF